MAQKKQIILRIDPDVWKALNEWAKDDLRSLNGQIEYVLREELKRTKRLKKEVLKKES